MAPAECGGDIKEIDYYQYEEGTLILDFVEPVSKNLIWNGAAKVALDFANTPEKRDKLIKRTQRDGGIMTIEVIRSALAWCTVINWGLLLWWFLFFTLAHDWIYRFHSKWFDLSVDKFDAIHYAGMALFKLGIFLFNLVPYFALRIVG